MIKKKYLGIYKHIFNNIYLGKVINKLILIKFYIYLSFFKTIKYK